MGFATRPTLDSQWARRLGMPTVMASNTKASENRRKRSHLNMGRARKNKLARKSTPSAAELFASLGAPGQPAPKK